jgi:hypothetical protein
VDDQVAMNEVVFSRHFLGLGGLRVKVLDPWVWATPAYYSSHLQGDAPPGPGPVLLHMYSKTGRQKADLFRDVGLWFLQNGASEPRPCL